MNTFLELLAAHRADSSVDLVAPITDVARVASLVLEGTKVYDGAAPEDKAVIGPLVIRLADHRDALSAKAAAAAALDEKIAAVRSSVAPPETPTAPVVADPAPTGTEAHTAASAPPVVADPAPTGTEAHTAASAPPVVPGAIEGSGGAPTNVEPQPTARVAAFQAAANTDQPVGAELNDSQLGELFAEAARMLGNGEGQVKVASMQYIDPRCPGLSGDQAAGTNTVILKQATRDLLKRNLEAKVAAANALAGFAGPAEYKREIPFASESMRPIASVLRRVPIKGVIKHYRAQGLTSTAGGATLWSMTQQQALDPADGGTTWKPVTVLTADNAEVTVTPYAIWGGLEWDVFQEMSAPERVDEAKKTLGANLARVGDRALWDNMIALGGTIGTLANPIRVQLGAFKGFLELLETLLTDLGYAQRMMTDNWRPIFPFGFEHTLSIDKRNGQFGESGLSKSDIDAELRKIGLGAGVYAMDDPTIAATRPLVTPFVGGSSTMSITTANTSTNVTVASTATLTAGMGVSGTGVPAGATIASITNATTFVLSAAATATGTVTGTFTNAATQYKPLGLRKWPITIFDPASVFMGQRGVLTAAVETDATLNRQNRKRYRLEDMEAVGRDGVNAPITLWVQLAPSGTSAIDISYDIAQADFATT